MASLTQIGAKIVLEGAEEFKSQFKAINTLTKDLNNQMKVLTSSFDATGKTTDKLRQQKELLAKQIENTANKLDAQKKELELVTEKLKEQGFASEDQARQLQNLQNSIANTEVQYNNLLATQQKLAQDNSFTLFVDNWKNASNKTGEYMAEIGGTLTKYVTLPVVGGFTAAIKTAGDFESAFTGVEKTVKASEEELTALNNELKKIPLETGSTYETVAKIAEQAGQLNVPTDKIAEFTRVITMLGDSTNINAEEGAVQIAQFLNIMGEGPETASKFGSALVELGNNMATDESSILRLGTRLASAGKLAGLSTSEVLALSAAMSSLGLTAEAGGTAMSTTMKMISKDVATGGDNLKLFGEITGQTAEEFAQSWRSNPVRALEDFLVGMATLEGGSEEVIQLLDELGFSGIRQSDTLQRLTSNTKLLTDALEMSESAYENNTALSDEASRRYEDFNVQVSQLKEAFKQLLATIGEDFLKDVTNLVNGLTDMITKFQELDPETRKFYEKLLLVGATIGPLIMGVGNVIIWIAKLKGAFGTFSKAKEVTDAAKVLNDVVGTTAEGAGASGTGLLGLGGAVKSCAKSILGALPTISLVGIVGAGVFSTLNDAFDENGKVTKEWSDNWKETFENYNSDIGAFTTNGEQEIDEYSKYIVDHMKTVRDETKLKSQEANAAITEGLIEMKEGVRGNLQEIKEIIDYDFKQVQTSMKNSTQEARRQTIDTKCNVGVIDE